VYPFIVRDGQGRKLDGANRYVMRVPPGQLPSTRGFWSLTMYNDRWFFVANSLNRYTLSQRNDLKRNADGSIDLHIQADNPGDEHAFNWLPAPRGEFVLMLRLYMPEQPPALSILHGTWRPPAVQRS